MMKVEISIKELRCKEMILVRDLLTRDEARIRAQIATKLDEMVASIMAGLSYGVQEHLEDSSVTLSIETKE